MKNSMEVGLFKTCGIFENTSKKLHLFRDSDIYRKYGLNSENTDLLILNGAYFGYISPNEVVSSKSKELRTSKTNFRDKLIIGNDNEIISSSGIRPVIKLSTMGIDLDKLDDKITEISYFEYPQTSADAMRRTLANEYLFWSTDIYVSFYAKIDDKSKRTKLFFPVCRTKYGKFIELISENKPRFIRIEPVEWIVDKRADIAVAKKILIPPIPLTNEKSSLKYLSKVDNFLNKTFAKDLKKFPTEFRILGFTKDEDKENAIKGNIALQILMKKHNLSLNDIELDKEGKPFIRSMDKK